MRRRASRLGLGTMAGCFVLAVTAGFAEGAFVTYSTKGILQRDPEKLGDPWDVGSAGLPFEISMTVDTSAIDHLNEVAYAQFSDIASASFTIGGDATTVLLPSINTDLFFYDYSDVSNSDIVVWRLSDVVYKGIIEPILVGASIDSSSFSFSAQNESPPVFPSTTSTTSSVAYGGGHYVAFLDVGIPVTVSAIPESASLAVWSFLIMIGIGFQRWRTCRS
jgi:hypothetical protein